MPGYGRALRRACPRCGHSPIFRTFFDLVERCGSCGLLFEREPGYWLGAMILNTAFISVLFLATLGLGISIFWPDVPWDWLMVGVILLTIIIPILFYPLSKTLWLAIDLTFRTSAGDRDA
jgi:uncharacterized protein (DUF983 family)